MIDGIPVGGQAKVPEDIENPSGASPNSMNREGRKRREPGAKVGVWTDGEIKQSIPGANSLLVKTDMRGDLTCKYAPAELSRYMGVKDCTLPPEGTLVLVYIPADFSDGTGVVVCTLPSIIQGSGGPDSKQTEPLRQFSHQVGQEPGYSYFNIDAYKKIIDDKANDNKVKANAFRPFDVLPSELYKVNDAGCFMGLLTFMSLLGASDRAKIETFIFDDLVRLTSGQWQHYHGLGETQIYNDEGHITLEFAGSWFHPEVLGEDSFKNIITVDRKGQSPEQSQFIFDQALRTMKRRFQLYLGALGDFAQLFIASPEKGTETMTNESKHPGVLHASIGGDGQLNITSAAGISFRRWDKIPTPKKLKEPYDPEGDSPSGDKASIEKDLYKEKKEFEYTKGHPYARNLQHRDESAFRRAQTFQRFDEMEKDYYTAEESDLELPKDEYDHLKSKRNFQENEGKQAGWDIAQDGSLHFWDAYGSEMYFRGGMIILSAPAGIYVETGGQFVAMGRDTILKAKNSADITTTDGDVRIAAEGNMHLFTRKKGMLFETESSGVSHGFDDELTGEKVNSYGITFKAPNSSIFLWGKHIIASAAQRLVLKSKEGLHIIGEFILNLCDIFVASSKDGKGGIIATSSFSAVVGETAVLAGGSSVGVFQGDKIAVPLQYVDAVNIYNLVTDLVTVPQYEAFYTEDEWLGSYSEEERDKIAFTFRSTEEYKTDFAAETYIPSPTTADEDIAVDFRVYETLWQYYLRVGKYDFLEGTPEKWKEEPVNDTFPWPGKDARTSCYFTFGGEKNVEMDGTSKAREGIRENASSGGFDSGSIDDYIIVNK